MDRVYGSNVSGTAPTAPAVPLVGFPRAGNSLTGEKATRPGPYWFHMITEELRNVITAAGLVPDPEDLTQLATAIQLLSALPAGAEVPWGGSSVPSGFAKLNGSVLPVASVPKLVENVYCGDANNATAAYYYRCSDPLNPTTTRNVAGAYLVLKDARGRFVRGLSDGAAIDAGRSLWQYQGHAFQAHDHQYYSGLLTNPLDGGGLGLATGLHSKQTEAIYTKSGYSAVQFADETRPDNYPSIILVKV